MSREWLSGQSAWRKKKCSGPIGLRAIQVASRQILKFSLIVWGGENCWWLAPVLRLQSWNRQDFDHAAQNPSQTHFPVTAATTTCVCTSTTITKMEGTKRKRDDGDDSGDVSLPKKAKIDNKENIGNESSGTKDSGLVDNRTSFNFNVLTSDVSSDNKEYFHNVLDIFTTIVDELFPDSWSKSKKQCVQALHSRKQDIVLGKQAAVTSGGKSKSVYVGTPLSTQVDAMLRRLHLRGDDISWKPLIDSLEMAASPLPLSTNKPLAEQRAALSSVLASLAVVSFTFTTNQPHTIKVLFRYLFHALFHDEMKVTNVENAVSALDIVMVEEAGKVVGRDRINSMSKLVVTKIFHEYNVDILWNDILVEHHFKSHDMPLLKAHKDFVEKIYDSSALHHLPKSNNVSLLVQMSHFFPTNHREDALDDIFEMTSSFQQDPSSANWESWILKFKSKFPAPTADKIFTPSNICMNPVMRAALAFSRHNDLQEYPEWKAALLTTLVPPISLSEKAGAGLLLTGDEFRIVKKLGSGSFSVVYHAIYKQKFPVALKLMAVQAKDVLKEVGRALVHSSRMDDDYVVRTLGYFILNQNEYSSNNLPSERDQLYIVVVDELGEFDMEVELDRQKQDASLQFVSDDSSHVKRVIIDRLDINLPPLVQLLESIEHMHGKGIHHRDVKTMNVLRVNGVWKIADWGSAKGNLLGDKKQTLNVGTEDYLPPEAESAIYGPYTDVFAFGMVIYEMLVGKLPPTQVSPNGNDEWYKSNPIFQYQHLVRDEDGNDVGIGPKLKGMLTGMMKYEYKERSSAKEALGELKYILDIHNSSKKRFLTRQLDVSEAKGVSADDMGKTIDL